MLMQYPDMKMKKYRDELIKRNIEIFPMPSPLYYPYTILKSYISRGKPKAVIFRYLNDYSSVVKTLIRVISEFVSLMLLRLLRIRVIWICHNVDRESKQYFPKLSRFRRKVFAKMSHKIFVMDPLLVKYGKRVFPSESNKISSITFGKSLKSFTNKKSNNILDSIEDFIKNEKVKLIEKKRKPLIASCVGNPNDKNLSYLRLIDLLDKAEEEGYDIRVILIGPIGNYLIHKDPKLLKKIKEDKRIFFIDDKVEIDEYKMSKYVDFYWRVYNDYSVPFTVYHATALKKPILTQNVGFLGEMVEAYNLGEVVDNNWKNLSTKLKLIQEQRNYYNYDKFLETHSWYNAGNKMIEQIL